MSGKYLQHKNRDGSTTPIHGFIGYCPSERGEVYFTGLGWSPLIDDAKIFVSVRGCRHAMNYHHTADHTMGHLSDKALALVEVLPIKLTIYHDRTGKNNG